MAQFRHGGAPPPPGPRDPILRLRAHTAKTLVGLSSTWWSVVTHWDAAFKPKGRSFPCEAPLACAYCQAEVAKRWKAYLHVLEFQGARNEEAFLELTPAVCEFLIDQLGEDCDLRGQQFTLTRGGGDKARLAVSIQRVWKPQEIAGLPSERSPELELMRLWGLQKRQSAKQSA